LEKRLNALIVRAIALKEEETAKKHYSFLLMRMTSKFFVREWRSSRFLRALFNAVVSQLQRMLANPDIRLELLGLADTAHDCD
jgi:hypothetical protein